jgi:hypothetical protein
MQITSFLLQILINHRILILDWTSITWLVYIQSAFGWHAVDVL